MPDNKSRVFVVQEPVRWNPKTREAERKFDLTPAAAYGELIFLLSNGKSPLNTAPLVHDLRRKLADYSDNDYIVPTGNPTAMGLAIAIAATNNQGNVRLLVWNGEARNYICVTANIYGKVSA
jgi:hypothetical protein